MDTQTDVQRGHETNSPNRAFQDRILERMGLVKDDRVMMREIEAMVADETKTCPTCSSIRNLLQSL